MPEISPFVAASPGALAHLQQNPAFQKLLQQGIFKDIWGSEWAGFMGIPDAGTSGEIPENPQGHNQAFAADVAIYRCVDIRGGAIASVPLKVYTSPDPNKRKEVAHEALGVLQATNPAGYVAGPQLLRYSLGSRDLHGSFAWRIVYDTGGRIRAPLPRELYWMPPAQYTPVSGADLDPPQPKVPFAGLKIRPGNQKPEKFIPANEVVYAPTYNPTDPLRGTSKLTCLNDEVNLRRYGTKSNLWFFRNNQRPDVVVTGAFSPTVENVSFMRRIWRAAFGGDQNRGPAFLPQDMSVHLLTIASKDAEWLGQRHASREDILAAFGVPPPVYGDLSRATYENIRAAWTEFWRSNMIPEFDEIAWFMTQQLLWRWPDALRNQLVFGFDYTQIEALQEDANAIWERVKAALAELREWVTARILTPNQARALGMFLAKQNGWPTAPFAGVVPGGDMFYVRIQEIPIVEASVQANIDIQAARAGNVDGTTHNAGGGSWTMPDAVEVPAPAPALPAPVPPPPPPAPAKQKVTVRLPRRALEPLRLALPDDPAVDPEPPGRPPEPAEPQRAPDVVRAEDWLTRRLKRHFQDQQTAALRALRAALGSEEDAAMPEPSALLDAEVGRERAQGILSAGAGMAGLEVDVDQLAEAVEADTLRALEGAMAGEEAAVVDRVRAVFRLAIEERAAAVALAVVGGHRAEEDAA